jgi:hypothetical protein
MLQGLYICFEIMSMELRGEEIIFAATAIWKAEWSGGKWQHLNRSRDIHLCTKSFLSHVLLVLLFVFKLLLVNAGFLVLLVLRNQVVHVALGLSEFHLIHA